MDCLFTLLQGSQLSVAAVVAVAVVVVLVIISVFDCSALQLIKNRLIPEMSC